MLAASNTIVPPYTFAAILIIYTDLLKVNTYSLIKNYIFKLTYNSVIAAIVGLYNLKIVLFINYINKLIKIQQKTKINIICNY
jgi:hypothetical protein